MRGKPTFQPCNQLSPVNIDVERNSPEIQQCIRLVRPFLTQILSELTAELKANLVETMMTCLRSSFNYESVLDCCTELLAKLEIFDDPTDECTKTAEILLKIISNPNMSTTDKTSTIWLLGAIMLESGEGEDRQDLVGRIGVIEKICGVIKKQLNNPTYNRILRRSWICLSNLCRFSLENSKKFLSVGGIDLFHLCYEKFGDKVEMVEEMMGLMLNLSYFATGLVSKQNFNVFWKIFQKFSDNVAISWRCVNTFDNFISFSATIWPLDSPTVEDAKSLLIETINKWKLNAQINTSRNSFEVILENLRFHISPLTELIIVWTIANLTTINDSKYCRMLSEEGGVEILTTEVIRHSNSSLDAVVLAKKAIDNVSKWARSADQQ